eukprot:jgi/Antlo1/935/2451
MDKEGQCQRVKKLKLAFKKAISEAFKDKDAIKKILLSKDAPDEDLSLLAQEIQEADTEDYTDHNNIVFENLFEELKQNAYDAFRSALTENRVVEKLEGLDRMIRENRVNLRDFRSKDYIQEVYESHIVGNKIELCSRLEEAALCARERKNNVRAQNEALTQELEELKKKSELQEQRFQRLVDSLGRFSR